MQDRQATSKNLLGPFPQEVVLIILSFLPFENLNKNTLLVNSVWLEISREVIYKHELRRQLAVLGESTLYKYLPGMLNNPNIPFTYYRDSFSNNPFELDTPLSVSDIYVTFANKIKYYSLLSIAKDITLLKKNPQAFITDEIQTAIDENRLKDLATFLELPYQEKKKQQNLFQAYVRLENVFYAIRTFLLLMHIKDLATAFFDEEHMKEANMSIAIEIITNQYRHVRWMTKIDFYILSLTLEINMEVFIKLLFNKLTALHEQFPDFDLQKIDKINVVDDSTDKLAITVDLLLRLSKENLSGMKKKGFVEILAEEVEEHDSIIKNCMINYVKLPFLRSKVIMDKLNDEDILNLADKLIRGDYHEFSNELTENPHFRERFNANLAFQFCLCKRDVAKTFFILTYKELLDEFTIDQIAELAALMSSDFFPLLVKHPNFIARLKKIQESHPDHTNTISTCGELFLDIAKRNFSLDEIIATDPFIIEMFTNEEIMSLAKTLLRERVLLQNEIVIKKLNQDQLIKLLSEMDPEGLYITIKDQSIASLIDERLGSSYIEEFKKNYIKDTDNNSTKLTKENEISEEIEETVLPHNTNSPPIVLSPSTLNTKDSILTKTPHKHKDRLRSIKQNPKTSTLPVKNIWLLSLFLFLMLLGIGAIISGAGAIIGLPLVVTITLLTLGSIACSFGLSGSTYEMHQINKKRKAANYSTRRIAAQLKCNPQDLVLKKPPIQSNDSAFSVKEKEPENEHQKNQPPQNDDDILRNTPSPA